jgi:hypothetical protein
LPFPELSFAEIIKSLEMISFLQAFPFAWSEHQGCLHPQEYVLGGPALLAPSIPGPDLDQWPERIIMPGLIGTGIRKLGDLLPPSA